MNERGTSEREFLGLRFDLLDAEAARRCIVSLVADGFSYVVTPNVDHIVRLDRASDTSLQDAYDGAALCLCDSRILARLARLSGLCLPVVPGSDLTWDLLGFALEGGRLAVVGGDAGLHQKLASRYPRFDWIFHAPPMGLEQNVAAREAVIGFVEVSAADVTLFAVGSPQSELLCREIAVRGRARGTALCIGASLEFLVGAKRRAPAWMQRAGLEWLFRLLSEPRRLWRRYLVDGPKIFSVWHRWKAVTAARARFGSTRFDGG